MHDYIKREWGSIERTNLNYSVYLTWKTDFNEVWGKWKGGMRVSILCKTRLWKEWEELGKQLESAQVLSVDFVFSFFILFCFALFETKACFYAEGKDLTEIMS